MLHPPKARLTAGLQIGRRVGAETNVGVEKAAAAARRAIKAMARPAGDFDSSRYFRAAGDLGFHNVGTSAMRALARRIYEDPLDVVYDIARSLHADKEDLIQKAVGWTLREAGKTDSVRLERYLRANGPAIPRTTLRYAIERFPETRRKTLLKETRDGRRS